MLDLPTELIIQALLHVSKKDWKQARLCCRRLNAILEHLLFKDLTITHVIFKRNTSDSSQDCKVLVHQLETLAGNTINKSISGFVLGVTFDLLYLPFPINTSQNGQLVKLAFDSLVNLRTLRWSARSRAPTALEELAFNCMTSAPCLEELTITKTRKLPRASSSFAHLRRLKIVDAPDIQTEEVVAMLRASPNLTHLEVNAPKVALSGFRDLLPPTLLEMRLGVKIDCQLPTYARKALRGLQIKRGNDKTSSSFWDANNFALTSLEIPGLNHQRARLLKSSPTGLTELHITGDSIQDELRSDMYEVLLCHAHTLERLSIPLPGRAGSFTMDSDLAAALGRCSHLKEVGVLIEPRSFGGKENQVLDLLKLTAQRLLQLTKLYLTTYTNVAWSSCGTHGFHFAQEGATLIHSTLTQMPIETTALEYFQRLEVWVSHIRGYVSATGYRCHKSDEDGEYRFSTIPTRMNQG